MTNLTEARAELARLESETEAARKRVAELEREPRRGWLALPGAKAACASVAGGYLHATKEAAHAAIAWSDGWVIPMVELRPGWALVKAELIARAIRDHDRHGFITLPTLVDLRDVLAGDELGLKYSGLETREGGAE